MARQPIRSSADDVDAGSIPAERMLLVGLGVVVLSAVAAVVVAALQGWTPTSDQAFIELGVRDIPSDPPLLGAWSRYGWSHPGPAQLYLLWPAYLIAGSSSVGLIAGTVALHTAAVVGATLVARRLDLAAGVMVLVALVVVLLAAGAGLWRDPWNPWVGLVGVGLLVVLAWDLAERGRAGAVAALPVASILLQAHLGVGATVVAVLAAAAGMMLWWPRTEGAPPVPTRALAGGALISVVLWTPPVLAQLLGRPGRFTTVLTEGAGEGARAGFGTAAGAVTASYAPVPSWADPGSLGEVVLRADASFPLWLTVPVGGLVVAIARRDGRLARGVALSLVAVAAAAVGVAVTEASPDGAVFAYLAVALRPTAAISIALGAAAIVAGLPLVAGRRVLVSAGAAGVVLAATLGALQPWASNPAPGHGAMAGALAAAVLDAGLDDRPMVLVDPETYPGSEGVLLELERAGVDVVVDRPDFRTRVGERRVEAVPHRRLELLVTGLGREERLMEDGWAVVARCRLLDDDTRREVLVVLAERSRLLERRDELLGLSGEGTDRAALDEVRSALRSTGAALDELLDDRVEGLVAVRVPPGGEPLERDPVPVDACGG